MKKIQRSFFPGDKWIYFKIYAGYKISEETLLAVIFPLVETLMRKKIIRKWFFIRYMDTGYHIRLRLWLDNPEETGSIIRVFYKKMKKYCHSSLVYKIELSTYERELERYGNKHIVFSENLFCTDSECILAILKILHGKSEDYRWMIAFKLIDTFLNDIGYGIEEKLLCLEKLNKAYKVEFGYTQYNTKQLNEMYRQRRPTIEFIMKKAHESPDIFYTLKFIEARSEQIQTLCTDHPFPKNNCTSYIHMTLNRLFRSETRVHELLIYEFLYRYYKSENAQMIQK